MAKAFSGAVGIFGRVNSGKSTLINALVGEKVSIVSPFPQTTRKRILGILTKGNYQIIFCDTPGVHPIKNRLDCFMEAEISETLHGLQGALYLVDSSQPKLEEDAKNFSKFFSKSDYPIGLVFTKIDLVDEKRLEEVKKMYSGLEGISKIFSVSANKRKFLDELLNEIFLWLPEQPHAYEPDFFTLSTEREISEEIIREQVLLRYYHEIPHSVAIVVEDFKERKNGKTYINAALYLEKESQKAILIGKGGEGLKRLGIAAREQLNHILGRDIFLQIWVKIRPNWRQKEAWVKRFGYKVK